MKRIIFKSLAAALAVAAAAILPASCEKVSPSPSATTEEFVPEGSSRVTLSFSEPATKAGTAATTAEKSINSLQVLVFDKNGRLEAVMTPSIAGDKQSATATATITNGQKSFRAVANGEAFSATVGTTTVSDFDNAVSTLSTNTVSGLVMTAAASKKILSDDTIALTLSRLCSKVCLTSVLRNYTDADLGELTLKVTGVWINNVAGKINWSAGWGAAAVAAGDQTWYNQFNANPQHPDLQYLLYDDLTDYTLAQGGSNTSEHVFYVYSNPATATTEGGSWSPRVSRMVVGVQLAGMSKTMYYAAALPQTDPNKVYNVQLTLQGLPSDNPDTPSTPGSVSLSVTASVTVSDWGAAVDVPATL